jgi:pyruvate/2-oxoglutarate dehydrogenase complex dihydrolipoamide dehydrogenase (E3) component
MGEAIEGREGFVKFLVGKYDRILGCHIILSSYTSILINEVPAAAIRLGAGINDNITKTVHIKQPVLSEVVVHLLPPLSLDKYAEIRPFLMEYLRENGSMHPRF